MQYRNYTDAEMLEAIKSSRSVRQVLNKLGLKEAGGNYHTVKQFIIKNNINTDHFCSKDGRGWNKGKQLPSRRPIEDYFNNKQYITSHKLKKRLIRDGIFEHKCSVCQIDKWNDKPISLELDHIDGNKMNNSLDNLRILCPNCHSQTPTHRRPKTSIWKNTSYSA